MKRLDLRGLVAVLRLPDVVGDAEWFTSSERPRFPGAKGLARSQVLSMLDCFAPAEKWAIKDGRFVLTPPGEEWALGQPFWWAR